MQDVVRQMIAVVAFLLACGSNSGSTESSATGATVTDMTKGDASTTVSSSSTLATSTAPTSGTEATSSTAGCGNGNVDPGESCDDGNRVNGDGCSNDCRTTGEQVWEYRSGLAEADASNDVTVTLAGDLLVCGYRSGQNRDRWVAKFDKQGGEIWSKTYDAPGFENLLGIVSAPTMAYVVGSVNPGVDGHDIWVAGVDENDGKLKWQDTFSSGLGDDYATSVALIPGGDAIVVGLDSTSGGRIWARRYSQAGAEAWTNTYSSVAPLYSIGPTVAVSGEQIVVATTDQSGPPLTPEKVLAIPLTGGAELWSSSLPDTNGILLGVAVAGKDLAVTGRQNFQDFVVRRLSPAGDKVVWSSLECVGGTGRGVAVDSQGDIVVIGDGPGQDGENIRLCKFSADGQFRWGKDVDSGLGDDRGFAVQIAESDQIVAVGSMADGKGVPDAWIAMFAP